MSSREIKTYEHTSAGLRDALFDELADLRNGVTTPHYATAVSKIATNILHSVELDLRQAEIAAAKEHNRLLALSAPQQAQIEDQSDEDDSEGGGVLDLQPRCELEA